MNEIDLWQKHNSLPPPRYPKPLDAVVVREELPPPPQVIYVPVPQQQQPQVVIVNNDRKDSSCLALLGWTFLILFVILPGCSALLTMAAK